MSESHDKAEEVISVDSHHSSIASVNVSNHVTLSNVLENPSHPKDLVGTQDGAENVNSSDDKVVGAESVSPFDTSYVTHGDIDDDGVAPAIDALVDCSSQTDSLEANWGSISDREAILSSDSRATTEKQAGSLEPSMPVVLQIDKPEILELPSFMKLVVPKIGGIRSEEASESQTSKAPTSDGSLQGGWFPSVSYGTSESPVGRGMKKLSQSKENPPSPKEKDAIPAMKTGDPGMNVLVFRQQQTISEAVEAAAAKEWNSPARYPTNTKRGEACGCSHHIASIVDVRGLADHRNPQLLCACVG
ncbi:hypothetical protein AKJ16_DCAP24545 [Drosera capensis]